jgi:hypothetical protein
MKRLYYLLVVVFVAMATNASAQFVQSTNQQATMNTTYNSGADFFAKMPSMDYDRFYVGYNPVKIKWEDNQSQNEDVCPFKNGITVGYLHASNIVKNFPLYLEYGANFMYSFGKDKTSSGSQKTTYKTNMYSLNVPVSLALRLSFNNDKVAMTPYLGLNFRLNIAGNIKKEVSNRGDSETETSKLFDSSDNEHAMGDRAFKRFQTGFNFGVGFTFNSVYLGVGHVVDFSKIAEYEEGDYVGKLGVTTISLGIAF